MNHQCCLPTLSSHSLGRHYAGHDIKTKLQAAASHGFRGIELVFEDIEAVASRLPGGPTHSNLIAAAEEIRKLTESLSLTIIDLQAFSQYEGLISRTAHAMAIEKAKLWFKLAHVLGTNIILIPSNFLPAEECTSDLTTIVQDMTELADLGAKQSPPITFMYENLCWGTHIDNWEGVHAVVSKVDRWNFGYCLDAFNIAGRVYGDPTSADGKTETGDADLADSMRRMVASADREKIFLIQLVDAERVSQPITPEHPWYDPSQPPRMSWSRNARLFPFEEERGGYLPIVDVCKALFEGLGFRGWVSFELFSRTLVETGPDVPEEHATRAEESWKKLVEVFPQIVEEPSSERAPDPPIVPKTQLPNGKGVPALAKVREWWKYVTGRLNFQILLPIFSVVTKLHALFGKKNVLKLAP
ncbi:unnamed protein product [Calypogeia fissa]